MTLHIKFLLIARFFHTFKVCLVGSKKSGNFPSSIKLGSDISWFILTRWRNQDWRWSEKRGKLCQTKFILSIFQLIWDLVFLSLSSSSCRRWHSHSPETFTRRRRAKPASSWKIQSGNSFTDLTHFILILSHLVDWKLSCDDRRRWEKVCANFSLFSCSIRQILW